MSKGDILDVTHLYTGFYGIVAGVAILIIVWVYAFLRTRGKSSFAFDLQGQTGSFEKFLTIYIDLAKFVLSLESASIVLLVGSSALREAGLLPPSFASPLFLLALSILYGILCMVFLTNNYEEYRHKTALYTRFKYTRNLALGYGSIFCFCVGYIWLIVIVT